MSRTLLAALFTLVGCGVVGDGQLRTESRTLAAFSRLEVSSAIQVVATSGTRGLTITAENNVLPHVETLVQNDALIVRMQPLFQATLTLPIRVELSNDHFEKITASGASNVTLPATNASAFSVDASGASVVVVTGLDAQTVNVGESGASSVTLTGSAVELGATLSGASKLLAENLKATQVSINVSGASEAEVRASNNVTGTASGASSVRVWGTPVINVSSSGASTVQAQE